LLVVVEQSPGVGEDGFETRVSTGVAIVHVTQQLEPLPEPGRDLARGQDQRLGGGLEMLVRIKNLLTAQQQTALERLRPAGAP
jgi:hypothetical protein